MRGRWREESESEGQQELRARCRKGQDRLLYGHESEWKFATDGGKEVGMAPPGGNRDLGQRRQSRIRELTIAVTHFIGDMEPEEDSRNTIDPQNLQPKMYPVYK